MFLFLLKFKLCSSTFATYYMNFQTNTRQTREHYCCVHTDFSCSSSCTLFERHDDDEWSRENNERCRGEILHTAKTVHHSIIVPALPSCSVYISLAEFTAPKPLSCFPHNMSRQKWTVYRNNIVCFSSLSCGCRQTFIFICMVMLMSSIIVEIFFLYFRPKIVNDCVGATNSRFDRKKL